MNVNIFVFGSDPGLSEHLSSSIKGGDTYYYPPDTPLDYSFLLGDIIILISDDMTVIKNTAEHISPEIPLLLITRKHEWTSLINYPLMKVLTLPLSIIMIKTYLEQMRTSIIKYKHLESQIVGKSRDTKKLRSNIVLASSLDSPVNIYGESGTGKTLAARLIHRLKYSDRDMVYINCANLSSSLADSDLFGHTKGAFTSANSSRKGLIHQAHESTLFLDEIGNLPLDQQAKLLDTIENGRYRNVGDDTEHSSNFRLITAAQHPLEELLEMKKLREDFYYRISSFSFGIKPLREHKEDIPEIVINYENKKKSLRRRISDFTPFLQSQWKGNIRELLHYLDRIFLI